MGIYPSENYELDRETGMLTREYNDFSGRIVKTYYKEVLTIECRSDCYCCTCGDYGDPYCRNHDMGYGKRPCEKHGMTGSTIIDLTPDGEEFDTGEYPESVQVIRRKMREQNNV